MSTSEAKVYLFLYRANGERFLADDDVGVAPRPGDIVTIKYTHSDKSGVPVRSKILRTREDITWQDVLLNYKSGLSRIRSPSGNLSPS